MTEIVNLFGSSTEQALRNIADMIRDGDIPDNPATIIIGTEVFHTGNMPIEQSVMEAVWDMNFGIHKLMRPIFEAGE